MSWLDLATIATMCGGELIGENRGVSAVSTDSRSVTGDELFIALKGERFDAHDFITPALDAAAVMVVRRLDTALPQILVDDTRLALGRLAGAWRKSLGTTVVGLTGSNGKTTVKEMTASILAQLGETLATRGNLNNDIGVPLTLLRLRETHDYAVIEMGANHHGEIAYLTAIAAPDVALITNAGPAHLEGFGSIEGVSRAKGEIFQGLVTHGVAVLNADDTYFDYWGGLTAGHKTLSFGLDQPADFSGKWNEAAHVLQFDCPLGQFEVKLPLSGKHNARNALCAAAAASAVGAHVDEIIAGLQALQPVAGRLEEKRGANGARVIDDSYNANPASMHAAVDVLASRTGTRVLVLGDMGELGADAEGLHAELGDYARKAGVDRLLTTGKLTRHASDRFGAGAEHFENWEALVAAVRPELGPEVTVLVKGSRSSHMERVVSALEEQKQDIVGSDHVA